MTPHSICQAVSLESSISRGGSCPRLGQNGTGIGPARLSGDRTDDRHDELERENERLKVLVGEKELALHIAKKARGL